MKPATIADLYAAREHAARLAASHRKKYRQARAAYETGALDSAAYGAIERAAWGALQAASHAATAYAQACTGAA
jgi:hypothetical protein